MEKRYRLLFACLIGVACMTSTASVFMEHARALNVIGLAACFATVVPIVKLHRLEKRPN